MTQLSPCCESECDVHEVHRLLRALVGFRESDDGGPVEIGVNSLFSSLALICRPFGVRVRPPGEGRHCADVARRRKCTCA